MPAPIPVQHLLPDSAFVCFVVPGLFTAAECADLLRPEIRNSFQQAIDNYPVYYRNNERLVLDDEPLSAFLFQKVKDYLPAAIRTVSAIEAEQGDWSLSALNTRLRFCKYSANQYFHRHLDGIYYKSATEQSKLTFMIYLNSATDFDGGRTLFYHTRESTDPWAVYIPRQGDLIVFDHNVWHEGEVLESGEKFVLRSDIIYQRRSDSRPRRPYEGHLGYIWALKMFDDRTLLSGGRDKLINVWDGEGQLLQSLSGHNNSVLCIEKMNEDTFISGSRDQQVLVWKRQPGTGAFVRENVLLIHQALVLSLCRLRDQVFASGSGDRLIRIVSLQGDVMHELPGHAGWVWQLVRLNETLLASGSEDGTVRVWDYDRGMLVQTIVIGIPVISLCYDEVGNRLLVGTLTGDIRLIALAADYTVGSTATLAAHSGIVRTIRMIDRARFASGAEDNLVKIWDIDSGECLATLPHHNFVQSLELAGDELLSSSYDGSIARSPVG